MADDTSSDVLPMKTSRLANKRSSQNTTLPKLGQLATVDGDHIGLLMRRQSEQKPLSERPSLSNIRTSTYTGPKPTLVPSSVTLGSAVANTRAANENRAIEQPQPAEDTSVANFKKELEEAKLRIAGLSHQLQQQEIHQAGEQSYASPRPVTTIQVHGNPEDLIRKLNLGSELSSPNDG